uniref:SMODS and SLOG-associating 2TM effector domain-containing protein n=1 Tax=Megaviridae environmental sample TaxID=1737588 RepID=A0A5J6VK57_9VIRU|nr:MAG: hypothetical protein [Megaviridae environmental sample]
MTIKELKRDYWKEEEELLLKAWADKAQCYQWMHSKSREVYQRKNALYTIPVIIISTITGTANFAQERFSDDVKPYANMTIGTLSILAGIITTISQFLKISEINEAHRVAAFSWGKFYRDINAELIRHPLDRTKPDEFMKYCKEEYNKLVEISPFISNKIQNSFNSKYNKNMDLVKPEINNLRPTEIFMLNDQERKDMILDVNKKFIEKQNKKNEEAELKNKRVNKFKKSFYTLHGKNPTEKEVLQNIKYIDDVVDYENSDTSNDDDTSITISSSPTDKTSPTNSTTVV